MFEFGQKIALSGGWSQLRVPWTELPLATVITK